MNRIGMAALALLTLAPPLGAQAPQPAAHSWRQISTRAPEVRPMVDVARAALPSRAPPIGVFRAEQQFLGAGMAYRLVLVLADESKWRVTLVPQSGGEMQVTQVEPVP